MEYLCSYCNKPFLPKRTDSLYCSHSCRQFAYVLRKSTKGSVQNLSSEKVSEVRKESTNQSLGEIQPLSKQKELNETIIETTNLSVKPEKEIAVKEETELAVKTDEQKITLPITPLTTKGNKGIMVNNDYTDHLSRYVTQLDQLLAERDTWHSLSKFFDEADKAGMWTSERYRCLIDVLLTFTEMKRIELDDLKEVCNAFTDILNSSYYQCLHNSYPYITEIKKLRDQIKSTCVKTTREQFKYRVSRDQKQNLIATRFELSQFVPKIKFSEIKFRGK